MKHISPRRERKRQLHLSKHSLAKAIAALATALSKWPIWKTIGGCTNCRHPKESHNDGCFQIVERRTQMGLMDDFCGCTKFTLEVQE